MARSLVSQDPRTALAAAAGAWIAAAAATLAMPVAHPWVEPARAVAAHGPAARSAWDAAARVYDELERARGLGREERTTVARVVLEEAARAQLAPLLVLAVMRVESGLDARAVSPAGAVGLMQLMTPTLREELGRDRRAGTDPLDPVSNVRAGIRYLARQLGAFSDVELALVAYNAGPNRLRRHLEAGEVPERLLAYPRGVLRELDRLEGGSRAIAARNAGTRTASGGLARTETHARARMGLSMCDGTVRAHWMGEEVVVMGRALEAARTRDLDGLFGYFGIEVEQRLVEAHREQIARRFAAEVRAIDRLCARLRERERFTIVREALRISYESAALRAA